MRRPETLVVEPKPYRHERHDFGLDRKTGRPIVKLVPVFRGRPKRIVAALLRDYDIRRPGAKDRAKRERYRFADWRRLAFKSERRA